MQAQVFEGYWEDGHFRSLGATVRTLGKRRAILALFDEPAKEEKAILKETREEWLRRLKETIALSMDEDLPDLPPRQPMRSPIKFDD